MKRILIGAAILLGGCDQLGNRVVFESATYVDDDFTAYVKGFELNHGAPIPTNLGIEFKSDNADAAECSSILYEGGAKKQILVSKLTWPGLCVASQEALVFHELAHCLRGREHREDTITFMRANLQTCDFYETNREALFHDMFGANINLYALPPVPETKPSRNPASFYQNLFRTLHHLFQSYFTDPDGGE